MADRGVASDSSFDMKSPPDFDSLQQAAEWFAQLNSGAATACDRAGWSAWLEQSARHREAWNRIESVGLRFAPLQREDEHRAASSALLELRGRRLGRRHMLSLLGATACAGLLGWGTWRHGSLLTQHLLADYRTGTGEIRAVTLDDGTKVWLNTASAVAVDLQSGERRLRLLAGEILIETAPAERPFVVDTAHGRLRPLGTRFSVRMEDVSTCVTVYEGAVEICPANAATAVVEAGRQQSFSAVAIGAAQPAQRARQAWSRGVLLADDIPLGELLAELGRYRHGYLAAAPEVAGLRVMGTFPLADPEKVLAMLEQALPVTVHRKFPWWTTVEMRTARS